MRHFLAWYVEIVAAVTAIVAAVTTALVVLAHIVSAADTPDTFPEDWTRAKPH